MGTAESGVPAINTTARPRVQPGESSPQLHVQKRSVSHLLLEVASLARLATAPDYPTDVGAGHGKLYE